MEVAMTRFSRFFFYSLFFVSFVACAQQVPYKPTVRLADAFKREFVLDQLATASSKKACRYKPGFLFNLVRTYPLTSIWFGLTAIGAAVHWSTYKKRCKQAEQQALPLDYRSDDDITALNKTKKDLFFDCIKNTAIISAACAVFCYMLKK